MSSSFYSIKQENPSSESIPEVSCVPDTKRDASLKILGEVFLKLPGVLDSEVSLPCIQPDRPGTDP